jgi:hypothetical protein
MNVIKATARRHVQNLITFVQNIHAELCFKIDEVGSEEWADRKPKKIFVPTFRAEETVHSAVKRGEQRLNAIVTISMAGDVLAPLLVIHRGIIERAICDGDDEDFVLRQNDSLYMTQEIFDDYTQTVFIESVKSIRKRSNCRERRPFSCVTTALWAH